jgi:hypothetical protein
MKGCNMLKYILLATTMSIAVPAMAQETPVTDPAPAAQAATPDSSTVTPDTAPVETAAPAQPVDTTAQTAPAPAEGQPAQTAQQPAPADPATQPAQTAAAADPNAPVTSETQIAAVVTKEFGTYDKDADGALDATEFASWMTALRTASEPTFKGDTPEAGKWATQAFAQADSDKSKTVNAAELTKFLTPKTAS